MVMRNRHDNANSPGWWDDLPPAVKKRIRRPEPSADAGGSREAATPESGRDYRPAVLFDLSRLVLLILVVALANILFLLVALSYLSRNNPLAD
jgi:hypothetical protein